MNAPLMTLTGLRRSVQPDVRRSDHLGPFFGFIGEVAKIGEVLVAGGVQRRVSRAADMQTTTYNLAFLQFRTSYQITLSQLSSTLAKKLNGSRWLKAQNMGRLNFFPVTAKPRQ